ncbi:MAG: hypothetical protein K5774_03815 [Clostridia bacterium]|nr:hypothetical protein [Clostridia bacterium]
MPLEIVRAAEAELGAEVYIGESFFDKDAQTPADFYREYLDSAAKPGFGAVAVPLITVDRDNTPKDELLDRAVSLIGGFLAGQPEEMTVYLTVEDDDMGAFTGERFDERFGGKFAGLDAFIAGRTAQTAEPASPEPANYNGAPLYSMTGEYAAAPQSCGSAPQALQAAKLSAPGGRELSREERREKRRRRLRDLFGSVKTEGTGTESPAEEKAAEEAGEAAESEASETFDAAAAPEAGREPELFFDNALMSARTDEDLETRFRNRESTFQEHLFRLIDRKGLDDVEVYKKANIDRKLFSKIKSNPNYRPSKRTVLAFAVALGLSIDETRDLLLKAGFALTRSDKFDIIMEYCIDHGIYNINEINCVLFQYEQPLLGA